MKKYTVLLALSLFIVREASAQKEAPPPLRIPTPLETFISLAESYFPGALKWKPGYTLVSGNRVGIVLFDGTEYAADFHERVVSATPLCITPYGASTLVLIYTGEVFRLTIEFSGRTLTTRVLPPLKNGRGQLPTVIGDDYYLYTSDSIAVSRESAS
jgi:hypothetical protein